MAEPNQIAFNFKEVAECLVKKQGITQGIWGIYFRFGLQATNMGPSPSDLHPAAIAVVLEIGLQKMEEESNLAVDAAKVNPKPGPDAAKPRRMRH
jgi:hypothetical protein